MTINPEEVLDPTLEAPEPVTAPPTSSTWRYGRLPYGLIAPSILVLLLVLAWPMYRLVTLSFQDYGLKALIAGSGEWIGLGNYTDIFTDSEFWTVLLRSVLFTTFAVTLTIVFGMAFALLMRRMVAPLRITFTSVLVLVWAMPALVSITIWKWLFDYDYGIVNYVLGLINPDWALINWFEDARIGLVIIGILVVWGALPFVAISLYAALGQVPGELMEAAMVDGAKGMTILRHVVMPIIKPVVIILVSLSIIWDFQVFAQIWVILEGRPTPEYYTIGVYAFVQSFGINEYGRGAAIAIVMLLVMLIASLAYLRQMRRQAEES
jgi:N,N'-diacetylchitobiose transport system permease protein